jgi:peroxiredoxin
MRIPGFILAAAVTAAATMPAGDNSGRAIPPGGETGEWRSLQPTPPEPPSTEVAIGDPAPNFSYLGEDNRWRRLRDIVLQGSALIVFGARDRDLRALDRERDALVKVGVNPVAVLDAPPGGAWSTARRLGLRYVVIPDSRRVIAGQFNLLDASGAGVAPGWFLVDRRGTVRGLDRGALPASGYSRLAARSLALPAADATFPGNSR